MDLLNGLSGGYEVRAVAISILVIVAFFLFVMGLAIVNIVLVIMNNIRRKYTTKKDSSNKVSEYKLVK